MGPDLALSPLCVSCLGIPRCTLFMFPPFFMCPFFPFGDPAPAGLTAFRLSSTQSAVGFYSDGRAFATHAK